MRRMRTALALALLLAVAPVASFASIVTYDFTVSGGPTGPLANVLSSGYFTYDDSNVTADKPYILGGVGTFVDFAFSWAGDTYNEYNAEPSMINFLFIDGRPELQSISFGNDCQPGSCGIAGHKTDWYAYWVMYGTGPQSWFSYSRGNYQFFDGTVTSMTLRSIKAPEPGMLSLMLAGMAGIGLFARRQRRVVASKQ